MFKIIMRKLMRDLRGYFPSLRKNLQIDPKSKRIKS